MKKLATIMAMFLIPILVLVIGLRVILGFVVASTYFRSAFNEQLERSLQSVLPALISEVKSTELTGIANLTVQGITVRNSRKISASLKISKLVLSPDWSTFFMGEYWHFDIQGMFGDFGILSGHASAPKWLFDKSSLTKQRTGALRIDGDINDLDAVTLSNLVFSDDAAPGFYLSRGLLTGNVQFSKPLGAAAAGGKKNARFLGNLKDSVWILAEDNNRPLLIAKIPLNLEMIGSGLFIRSPVILVGHTGSANITGGIFLPRARKDEANWNLIVNVDKDTGLSNSLAKLFKCKEPLAVSHYTVKGPVTGASCTP